MARATEILAKDENTEKSGRLISMTSQRGMEPEIYNKDTDSGKKEVLFIQTREYEWYDV